jgi:hypothetical protein
MKRRIRLITPSDTFSERWIILLLVILKVSLLARLLEITWVVSSFPIILVELFLKCTKALVGEAKRC